jgi:glycine/D-amino acid oxidase-like deaminating enzyme/nitrite reductase/ring-hydroxylating ferredoxin subunit
METKPNWFNVPLPQFPGIDRDLEVDVAIIGGGLTGITAAYLLKREGARVALVERQRCASADTGHTTAHLTYVTDTRLHQIVKTFGKDAARAFWEAGAVANDEIYRIVREENIDCEFKWVPGFLHEAFKDPAKNETELLETDAELARDLGFRAEFVGSVPYAKRPGVKFHHQAKFHPRKYLARLVERIPGDGSYVFENSEAAEIEEKPLAIKVNRFKVRCRYLIIATHTPLMGKTGLLKAALFQSKLALYTSYVLGARLPGGTVPEALFWDTGSPYYYLRVDRKEDHDYAIFGGDDCKTGQEEDLVNTFRRLEEQLKLVLPSAVPQHRWLGQVVETNDGLPFVGETAENQFVATGFCGNGFTLGTLSALMGRDRFLKRRNPWFELFDVGRKKFHGGTWRYITENIDYPYYMLRDRLAKAEADSTDEIKFGQGSLVKADGKKVAAYRDEQGKLTLLSPVCTHLKCIVKWNPVAKTWDCPCHGSRFKPRGEVLSGPAEEPLEKAD